MLENDGCPYVLEVNTIPGFTEKSLFPLAAREAGIPFADLCERLVDMALSRWRRSESKEDSIALVIAHQ